MQFMRVLIFFFLSMTAGNSLASADGPEIELVCPCLFEAASQSSATVELGVINRRDSTTGKLIVRAYAHSEKDYFSSIARYQLGDLFLSSGLVEKSSIENQRYQFRLDAPEPGDYYVTLLLIEDGVITDLTVMNEQITFGEIAASAFSDLYFTGDPSIAIDGDIVELSLPGLGNSGGGDKSVEVLLVAAQEADFFSGTIVEIGRIEEIKFIPAVSQVEGLVRSYEFMPVEGFDFYFLQVTDGAFTLLLHGFTGDFDALHFNVRNMDLLLDSDGDGVADDNEILADTDPSISSSTPGASYIDVLVLHDDAVTTHYTDPSARIDHLFAVSNIALADSGVDVVLRQAGDPQELDMDEGQNIDEWLSSAVDGVDAFMDLEDLRDQAGADLVTLFRLYDNKNICGLATLGGYGTQGIMARTEHTSVSFIEFDECGDFTMVHEVGHNLGLGHSFEQNAAGTWNWSRGHGEFENFVTIMAYASEFSSDDIEATELSLFSNPDLSNCAGLPCGVPVDQPSPANAVKSINAVRHQIAAFSVSAVADSDNDGTPDAEDLFPDDPGETGDNDNDGLGDNRDYDDDNDGMPDVFEIAAGFDPLVDDAEADADEDGLTNREEYDALPRSAQYLQTTSTSRNISRLHIVNTSGEEQSFNGTLFNRSGERLGPANQPLGEVVPAKGRKILTSEDIESLFGISAWKGPAMIEVAGEFEFALMSKLVSPSGLVSNTNCVRADRVLNIEGFDSENNTFVRFINAAEGTLSDIRGTLYDASGQVIGASNVLLIQSLLPKEQQWINRDQLAGLIGSEWNGEGMLEVSTHTGLKLLNLNFVNGETFFNFSCFESDLSGRVYLQTKSTSQNISTTHLVNTSDQPQELTGTLYTADGNQLGEANQLLGTVESKARIILESADIEELFNISPWSGPAMLEVSGQASFELMTKLKSPSGLISNTNCVRQAEVHNIEGSDSPDMTFIRLINTSEESIGALKGTLYGSGGEIIGSPDQELLPGMSAKEQVWLNRNHLIDIFGEQWVGEAALVVDGDNSLRLLNLNFINSETFFNFSCYETAGAGS